MIGVDYGVLNQKGSPSWFSDIYANIPTAGYKGRMFISIDTYAFYRDTGTGWDLIGGPGTGTLTGSGVSGQVSFFNGTQTITGNNNLFWDNTNNRLGINTATPGQALDIHSTANTLVQLNNTTTGDSVIAFQNQNVTKWKIGNVYNAGANSFSITNPILSSTPFTISSGDAITLNSNVTTTGAQFVQNGLYLTNANAGALAFYTNIWGRNDGINFALRNLTGGAGFIFQSAASYDYTFPASAGTLALTSNLSSYLPLTGGTLTGALVINPTNTLTIGLDVASNTTRFRSDNLEGNKRQLEIVMGSGTLVQLTAKGYLANYGTDMAFYTATTGGTNASPGIYITGTNNRVGIKTGTPSYDLDVTGTFGTSGSATFGSDVFTYNNGGIFFSGGGTYTSGILQNANGLALQSGTAVRMVIGSTGNVGIGTSSPNSLLTVRGTPNTDYGSINAFDTRTAAINQGPSIAFGGFVTGTSSGATFGLIGAKKENATAGDEAGYITFNPNNGGGVYTERMRISSAGVVTITNLGTGTVTSTSGVLSVVSDMNLKIEDGYIENALEKVINLKPRYFLWKDESGLPTNLRQLGFYAQEVNAALGEEVANTPSENNNWGIHDRGIIAMLTKAIQELNEKLVKNNIN